MEKTIGIKLKRIPNDSELTGSLVTIVATSIERDNEIATEINQEENLFILNRVTKEVKVELGISVERATVLKEELEKLGYREIDLIFGPKIEI